MGLYDRDYVRNERTGFFGNFGSTGSVVNALIAINVVAFLIQTATRVSIGNGFLPNSGPFTGWLDFSTDSILHGQVWRIVTYSFLHSTNDIWHIAFNMLLLWMVGREVESIYGSREFLAFYLISAVCGGLAQLAATLLMPGGVGGSMIGASGAVTAVLVLFALHFPTRVFYVFLFLPVPALVLVVLCVLKDLFALTTGTQGSVAVACHLGGALFGFLYYKFQWRITGGWPRMPSWRSPLRRRPKLRVFRGEPDATSDEFAEPAPVSPDAHLEEELDAVLEKVSRYGQSSLNERERRILMRASEAYRNKRK